MQNRSLVILQGSLDRAAHCSISLIIEEGRLSGQMPLPTTIVDVRDPSRRLGSVGCSKVASFLLRACRHAVDYIRYFIVQRVAADTRPPTGNERPMTVSRSQRDGRSSRAVFGLGERRSVAPAAVILWELRPAYPGGPNLVQRKLRSLADDVARLVSRITERMKRARYWSTFMRLMPDSEPNSCY